MGQYYIVFVFFIIAKNQTVFYKWVDEMLRNQYEGNDCNRRSLDLENYSIHRTIYIFIRGGYL